MKKVILVGGGGHALSVLEMVDNHSIFVGYADISPNEEMPIPYLGTDEEVMVKYSPNEYAVHHTLVYAKDVNLKLRQNMIRKYASYECVTFVSDTAKVTHSSIIGDGSGIFHGTILNRSFVGSNSIINTGAVLEHNSIIGKDVFVGPNATICGGTKIGDNVLIGAGSIIRDDIEICNDVVIGMGSIVTSSITESGVYVGSPAKLIKSFKNE